MVKQSGHAIHYVAAARPVSSGVSTRLDRLQCRQRCLPPEALDASEPGLPKQLDVHLTHRWRGLDSNFQYASAVTLVVAPACLGRIGAPFCRSTIAHRPSRQKAIAALWLRACERCRSHPRCRLEYAALARLHLDMPSVQRNQRRAMPDRDDGRVWQNLA
jgi:hypothetical protein